MSECETPGGNGGPSPAAKPDNGAPRIQVRPDRACELSPPAPRRHPVPWPWSFLGALLLLAPVDASFAVANRDLTQVLLEALSGIEVTSVSKSAEPLRRAPSAIYVISHADIIRSGATSTVEALRLAPNRRITQLTSRKYVISARGFGGNTNAQNFSNKVRMLIDGRSVYSPLFSGIYTDVQNVMMEDIDRIEVISGPGSTLLLPNPAIGQRLAQVRKVRNVAELGDAQILYVGPSHLSDLRTAVAAITTRPALLVTDDEHGLDEGGVVNFLLVDRRVRFEVSVLAAERSGLKISSELLAEAARVQGGRRRSDVTCGSAAGPVEPGSSCAQRVATDSAEAPPPRPGDAPAMPRTSATHEVRTALASGPNP